MVRAFLSLAFAGALALGVASPALAAPAATRSDVQVRKLLSAGTAAPHLVRIAKDPRDNVLYVMKEDGSIYRLDVAAGNGSTLTRVVAGTDYSAIITSAQGFAIGPDGTMYVVVDTTSADANTTHATIHKGVPNGGSRTWSILAVTADYPRSKTAFDHVFNGIAVNSAGTYVYINSGSRTDHGEVQDGGGLYPGLRESGLTAAIFELPTSGNNIQLPDDRAALKAAGYIFAEGTRNSFDLTFAPNGDLLATENGPDRDMPDELNWLRRGGNFGFPWRIGGQDNPQQFASYNPSTDPLLDSRFIAVQSGYYRNDPTFPASPGNLLEPVANFGPDADSFKDPSTGALRDASALGQSVSTFTPHRSPLGLVFVTDESVVTDFRGHAFAMGFTTGDATGTTVAGPFNDPSQDLLDLNLAKANGDYTAHATRIVGGFSNPIDNEAIANRIYVIEYGGDQGIYEVVLPTTTSTSQVAPPTFAPGAGSYAAAQSVTLATSTSGASIYYTTDGTTPACPTGSGSGSTVCGTANEGANASVSCPSGQTVSAVGFASYGTPTGSCGAFATSSCNAATSGSVVTSACNGQSSCSVPASNATFGDPCPGVLKSLALQVTCGGGTAAVGTLYAGAFSVSASSTVRAIACKSGSTDSAVVSADYVIGAPTQASAPTFTPAPGAYATAQSVSLASTTAGATLRYTTNNTDPTCSDSSGTTVCATADEGNSATVSCPSGTITAVSFASYGTPTGTCGAFTAGSCSASTSSSVVTDQCVGRASCTVAASNSVFGDPCPNVYKKIAIAATCSGSGNGTTYSSPIAVSTSQTIRAIACKAGLQDSSISSGSYTIAGSGAAPALAAATVEPTPTGGGCSAAGSGGVAGAWWMLMPLLSRLRRRRNR